VCGSRRAPAGAFHRGAPADSRRARRSRAPATGYAPPARRTTDRPPDRRATPPD